MGTAAKASGQSVGMSPGCWVITPTTNELQYGRNIWSGNALEATNARNYPSVRPNHSREGGCKCTNAAVPSSWTTWLQMSRRSWLKASGPLAWASRIASSCENIVEHGGEIGGRWAISDGFVQNKCIDGSSPTAGPDVVRKALDTSAFA